MGLDFLQQYLLVINAITFFVYMIDKIKAKNDSWRIKESTLMGLCIIGGSLGGLIGMYLFHHKIRKKKFSIGVPILLVIDVALYVILYFL